MGKHRRTRQRITSRFNPQVDQVFDKEDTKLEAVFRRVRDSLAWMKLLDSVSSEQRDLLTRPMDEGRRPRNERE